MNSVTMSLDNVPDRSQESTLSSITKVHYDRPTMSFVSRPVSGSIKILTYPATCREILCANYAYSMAAVKNARVYGKIDTRNVRILFTFNKRLEGPEYEDNTTKYEQDDKTSTDYRAIKTLNAINIIEKSLKWPLTRMSKVIINTNKTPISKDFRAYMFVGCSKWAFSQHVLSAYSFLLRAFLLTEENGLQDKKSVVDIIEFYKNMKLIASSHNINDLHNMKSRLNKILIFLKNLERIFVGKSKHDNYKFPKYFNINTLFHIGIMTITGHQQYSYDKEEYANLQKILKASEGEKNEKSASGNT